jgi:hypothetical protein
MTVLKVHNQRAVDYVYRGVMDVAYCYMELRNGVMVVLARDACYC